MGRLSKAVFLDRDGTLNVKPPDHQYLHAEMDFQWLAGAVDGIARLARAGYVLGVVSNQRGVARGLVETSTLRAIEQRIQRDLGAQGCAIARFRYCIHDNGDACNCRKPRPGLLIDLAAELHVDLGASWMVGDSESDVLAGREAGCRTILVGNSAVDVRPDFVATSLDEASHVIVRPCQNPEESVSLSNSSMSAE